MYPFSNHTEVRYFLKKVEFVSPFRGFTLSYCSIFNSPSCKSQLQIPTSSVMIKTGFSTLIIRVSEKKRGEIKKSTVSNKVLVFASSAKYEESYQYLLLVQTVIEQISCTYEMYFRGRTEVLFFLHFLIFAKH